MPKVTVVTLPTKMLETHQQVFENKKKIRRLPLRTVFNKVYSMLASLVLGKNVLLSILAFLLGRVFVMGEFAPVGLAFFAAVAQVDSKRALTVGLWSIIGVLSGGYYWDVGIYIFTICLYFLWADRLALLNKRILIVPIYIFFAVLCAGLVISIFKEHTLYNALLVLFEAATCMVLTYIFMYGVPLLTGSLASFYQQNLTNERLSCMVMLLATAVAGFGNIMVLEYSVRNIAGSLLVMGIALVGGAGLSAAVGAVVGLIVGLSDGDATLAVSLYSLAGVLAGVFQGLGKWAVIVGFILGNAITILYYGQATSELTRTLSECAIAGGLFLVVPTRWLTVWRNMNCQTEQYIMNVSPQVNETVVKINNIAEIFSDLAGVFGDITTATKMKIDDDGLARTLSVVGEQICVDCPKRSQCWEVDFYRTYHGILEILGQVEVNNFGMHNMPKLFKEKCIRCKDLLETIKMVSERNRTLTFWQKKIVDNRQMVTEQMKAASLIINGLAFEIGKNDCDYRELSVTFQGKAATLGCQLTAVRVTGVQGEGMIEAWKMPCNGTRECKNTILPLAAGLMKEKMTLHTKCGNENKSEKCKLTMKVVKRFNVDTGMASFAKDGQEVCGDTCAVMELKKGKVALVLSDGMGSGTHAEVQSRMAINFLQKLMVAGFDTDVAIKTVNSMLLLRSPEESFVTIDMAIIDTYSGNVEFLKIGSAPSFIKRVREVKVIKSSCLPIGILQQIEIQPVTSIVVVGDFIVMVSDGIMDVPHSNLDKGNWLANFLRQSVNSDPKGLANEILAQARTMSGNRVTDDMTVLVGKIVMGPN